MPTDSELAAYHALMSWTLTLRDCEFLHQHVLDGWGAQHATGESTPISLYFSLLGLYLHLERGLTGRQVQRAHMQLAQPHGRGPGRKEWPRFPLPKERGSITAADVMAAPENERRQTIERWCRSVWQAWHESHAAIAACVRQDLGI